MRDTVWVSKPLRITLLNDYEIVVAGLHQMFTNYQDRVEVVKLLADVPVRERVDIVLFDSFGQDERDVDAIQPVLHNPLVGKVAIYTWNINPHLVQWAKSRGVAGCLSKTLPAHQLVTALEEIHRGRTINNAPPNLPNPVGGNWPGREEGLSYREAEMVALITRGFSNDEIARTLYLSPNTVKSYIRIAYRKIGVTRRSQAVAWGLHHGFASERVRKEPPPLP